MRTFAQVFFQTALMLIVVGGVGAQTGSKKIPRFEDYPVTEIFNGTPHPPVLGTEEQRHYLTRIREGVEKGSGVRINGEWSREQNGPGPNFAGHYIVVVWGCGAGCLRMAVCDAKTGAVYDPPISADRGGLALPILMPPMSAGRAPDVQYRRDSRLMIIKATPDRGRSDSVSYSFYFLWQNNQWKLLRRIRLVDDQ